MIQLPDVALFMYQVFLILYSQSPSQSNIMLCSANLSMTFQTEILLQKLDFLEQIIFVKSFVASFIVEKLSLDNDVAQW